MSGYVLDSSALLAVILGEPGGEKVRASLSGAMISLVNLAEVVERIARDGHSDPAAIENTLEPFDLVEAAPDRALAIAAGLLGPPTRQAGLSLGDRFCLALARREGAVALTADRVWPVVADVVGVRVELIR